ncbi:hypothetical protein, partial [Enterococcus faecium]|uniref:hypothetical protein n=1 Tax=Enterococcus faecium TaxID=1352 RepID=UPI003AB0C92C
AAAKPAKAATSAEPAAPRAPKKAKLSFTEQHALKTLPGRIEKLQAEIAARFAERAVELFDAAWARGDVIAPAERGAASLAIMEAKVLAHRASLFVGQEAFEATGARATRA